MRASRLRLYLLLCLPVLIAAQDLKQFEKKITEFTLPNGLKFIVLERHDAPVVSFHTYVNAGSVDDPGGETGIAHMFEHMAFKGTDRIGTKNYTAEKQALDAVEEAYTKLSAERAKGARADAKTTSDLEAGVRAAIAKAETYVDSNAYPRLIEENGGVGLNAQTGEDSTEYFYSLPSNRVELWFSLESARFLHPVFREFYKERDVVREERRMRVESNPGGQVIEALLATAFEAHPYRQPTSGWSSDIMHLRVADARAFFQKYYAPANITIAIAGDVDPRAMKQLAEKHFGPIPARPLPAPLHTVEPPQRGEKIVRVQSGSQPLLEIAYKRPNEIDPDDPVFDVISGILSSGRTGWLYTDLVRDRKIAMAAGATATFPGGRYPSLFLVSAVPSMGHTVEENEKACDEVIERLKTAKVDATTLERVKTKVRAGLIRQLDSNSGMASALTFYEVNYGDWRKMFTGLEDIDKVTAEDVQRVARKYFVPEDRTVAYTVTKGEGK
jgi:predicted Zn-dependent peptidase